MPPGGTCDPASRGEAWNQVAQEIGPVLVEVWYGWDGASVMPDCVGPLHEAHVKNRSAADTWYVWMQGKKGHWRHFTLAPLFEDTFTQEQLALAGLDDNTDLAGLSFSRSPNPPPE